MLNRAKRIDFVYIKPSEEHFLKNNGDVYVLTFNSFKACINLFHHNLTNPTPENQPNLSILSSPGETQIFFSNPYLRDPQKPKRIRGAPTKKVQEGQKGTSNSDKEDEDYDERSEEQGVIPEIVTNRMMNRVAFSVGIPLFTGLLFFPFFYYLKVGLKIDVPNWVPFIVSFFFFGSALVGVSFAGIVSSSWDPLREGSLLGWNEAKKNWPVFWQSLRGGGISKK